MNCLDWRDTLQRQLDGEVLPDRGAFEQHLSACADCRELYGASQAVEGVLRARVLPLPPPHLTDVIVRRAVEDRRRRTQFRQRLVLTGALAAGLLLAVSVARPWLQPVVPRV